jgi:hypothetical protein
LPVGGGRTLAAPQGTHFEAGEHFSDKNGGLNFGGADALGALAVEVIAGALKETDFPFRFGDEGV